MNFATAHESLTIFDFERVFHFAFALAFIALFQRFDKWRIMRFIRNGIRFVVLLPWFALWQPLKWRKLNDCRKFNSPGIQKNVTIKFIFEYEYVILATEVDVRPARCLLAQSPISWHKIEIVVIGHRFDLFNEFFLGHCWRQATNHHLKFVPIPWRTKKVNQLSKLCDEVKLESLLPSVAVSLFPYDFSDLWQVCWPIPLLRAALPHFSRSQSRNSPFLLIIPT